jgi:hypothetical protein
MYIKQEDFNYMEGLYRTLEGENRKRFLDLIIKHQTGKAGEFADKVKVVSDDIFDKQAIDPKEFITRTAIKKAYKSVSGSK